MKTPFKHVDIADLPYLKRVPTFIWIFLFYCLTFVLVFLPVLREGLLIAYNDSVIEAIPAFFAAKVRWSDLLMAGMPVMADPLVQAWYPLAYLAKYLPSAWNMYIAMAFVGSGCTAYAFCYALSQHRLGSLFGGSFYAFNGFMIAHSQHPAMIHSAIWWPLLLLAVHKIHERWSAQWILIGSLTTFALCLCHPQMMVYCLLLTAVYSGFIAWQQPDRGSYYLTIACMMILGVMLAAVQLLPTWELMQHSERTHLTFDSFVNGNYTLAAIAKIFAPFHSPNYLPPAPYNLNVLSIMNGYMGIMPVLFASFSLSLWRFSREIKFWVFIAIFCSLVAFAYPLSLMHVLHHVPVYNLFRVPMRHMFFAKLGVSVLSAYGIANFLKRPQPYMRYLIYFSIFWLVWNLYFLIMNDRPEPGLWIGWGVIIPSIAYFFALGGLLRPRLAAFMLPASMVAALILPYDALVPGEVATPVSELQYPSDAQAIRQQLQSLGQRAMSLNGGYAPQAELPPNRSRLWGLPQITYYGQLSVKNVLELVGADTYGNLIPSASTLTEQDKSLDILNVRYLLSKQPINLADKWRYVQQVHAPRSIAYVYENKNVLPRAWLAEDVRMLSTPEILNTIKTGRFANGEAFYPGFTALIAEQIDFTPHKVKPGNVVISRWQDQGVSTAYVKTEVPAMLVISDSYYPGWRAKIDGVATKLYQVDHAIRGVLVPAGQHQIDFSYHPFKLLVGEIISVLGLLIMASLIFTSYLISKKPAAKR